MSHPIYLYYTYFTEWDYEKIKNSLTKEELYLANKMACPITYWQKIVQRRLLRFCLFEQYKISDEQTIINYTPKGKPLLVNFPEIQFSGSHSHDISSIALSKSCLLGWDVELIHKLDDEEEIIQNFFSKSEYESYKIASKFDLHAFYYLWTAKEASGKALGIGISEWDKLPEVIWQEDDFLLKSSNVLNEWSIVSFELNQQYCASLVTDKKLSEIKINYLSYKKWLAESSANFIVDSTKNFPF